MLNNNDYDEIAVDKFLYVLDEAWSYFQKVTNFNPSLKYSYQAKATITALPDSIPSCGHGCGYLGVTGIEVKGFYSTDYPEFLTNSNKFRHYYFYEMGRNFWCFETIFPDYVTAFAVFMRYVVMDKLNLEDPDIGTRKEIENLESKIKESPESFVQLFMIDSEKANDEKRSRKGIGMDQPALLTSLMLYFYNNYGGFEWVVKFHKELNLQRMVKKEEKEGQIRNMVGSILTASQVPEQEINKLLKDRWKYIE